MARDEIDRWIETMPEPKLELIDGRLVVGNSEQLGNRQLLFDLLHGWGPEAALPFAAPELWWGALRQGFRQFDPPAPEKPAATWQSWAAQLAYTPHLDPAGPMIDPKHRGTRQALMMGLFGLAHEHHFAHVSGRDVIMRLGEDAFTPDVFMVGPGRAGRLNEHYLDGPADLVIEVLLPGHEPQDRVLKRERYARGGVTEYWLVDPEGRRVEYLVLSDGAYRGRLPDHDGTYRPVAFPGLCFAPDRLWENDTWGHGPNPFSLNDPMPQVKGSYAKTGTAWGDLPYDPQPVLQSRPLSFEEFASWAPQAKFERIEGKPWVGGSRGSRNVLGMLLRTAGLIDAVSVLHPREWIAALVAAERNRAEDAGRREQWWAVARQAAALLRERFGFGRLAVIGDLVRTPPLNVWSDVTLVAFDLGNCRDTWEAGQALYERFRDEADINLITPKYASRSERQALEAEAVDL